MTTPPRGSWLAAFQVRSFRFQWPADLATAWAFEMETIILGWYVLVETDSVLLLTLFGSLLFLGTLVAPVFGLIGDRIGYRNLLCIMRVGYATLAATLMVLAFADLLRPLYVFAITVVAGLIRPSDLVMRNSIIGETIPSHQLMGAMSLSRTTNDSARVAGALAGAGLVAGLGMGWAYVVICSLYAVGLLLTLRIRSAPRAALAPRSPPWRDLKDGVVYVWTSQHLLGTMCLALLVNITAFPLTGGVLPHVVKDVYHADQAVLGYLVAGFAFGGLAGSIALSLKGGLVRPARIMLIFSAAWHASLLVFAHLGTPAGGVLMLMVAGFMQSLCMVPMSVMLLQTSEPRFRGRLMGVRMLAVYGLPIGLLTAGPLIEHFGFAPTATLYCIVGLLMTLLIALRWRAHLWHSDGAANAG